MSTAFPEAATSPSLVFDIEGMTCAACSARIETVLKRTPGVQSATVNLALERADVAINPGVSANLIVEAVDRAGYTARLRSADPAAARRHQEQVDTERRASVRRLWIVLLISVLFTFPFLASMIGMLFGLPMILSPWMQFALALIVQTIAGARFYRGAYHALKGGSANMDVLVVLGTTSAFTWSTWNVYFSHHGGMHLYFEASASILTLVLLGKLLEERAKSGTTAAIRGLISLRPDRACRLTDNGEEIIPVENIAIGNRLVVRPGERFAVDGEIISGDGHVDEGTITGESNPVAKHPGDRVIAGTINGEGVLTFTVTTVGEDTTLARVTRLVENAQNGKAPVQRLVDRISAIFVPVVLGLSIATFAGWLLLGGDMEQSVVAAIAVLVIACPCALGLATPTALVAGTGSAARAGILIKDIDALERAARIDHVVFDKTGTLTVGKPALVDQIFIDGIDPTDALKLAASAQSGSEHPLAHALMQAAASLELPMSSGFRSVTGKGITARADGKDIALGNPALMAELGISTGPLASRFDALEARAETAIYMAIDGKLAGVFGLADPLRPEAGAAVASLLDRHVTVSLLTGDNAAVAENVAKSLGIEDWRGQVRPADKLAAIKAYQKSGHHVAMIGDGVNDAPALAAANVGIAIGTGTDVAIETAAITLMRPDPRLVAEALEIAKATHRKIWQNLLFAFGYNVIGIPLAMAGQLTPALAGAAMAMSSVSVVTNAALLARWKPRRD